MIERFGEEPTILKMAEFFSLSDLAKKKHHKFMDSQLPPEKLTDTQQIREDSHYKLMDEHSNTLDDIFKFRHKDYPFNENIIPYPEMCEITYPGGPSYYLGDTPTTRTIDTHRRMIQDEIDHRSGVFIPKKEGGAVEPLKENIDQGELDDDEYQEWLILKRGYFDIYHYPLNVGIQTNVHKTFPENKDWDILRLRHWTPESLAEQQETEYDRSVAFHRMYGVKYHKLENKRVRTDESHDILFKTRDALRIHEEQIRGIDSKRQEQLQDNTIRRIGTCYIYGQWDADLASRIGHRFMCDTIDCSGFTKRELVTMENESYENLKKHDIRFINGAFDILFFEGIRMKWRRFTETEQFFGCITKNPVSVTAYWPSENPNDAELKSKEYHQTLGLDFTFSEACVELKEKCEEYILKKLVPCWTIPRHEHKLHYSVEREWEPIRRISRECMVKIQLKIQTPPVEPQQTEQTASLCEDMVWNTQEELDRMETVEYTPTRPSRRNRKRRHAAGQSASDASYSY